MQFCEYLYTTNQEFLLTMFCICEYFNIIRVFQALGDDVYVGKIELIPPCQSTACLKCDIEPNINVQSNCVNCPVCNSQCPVYKCSGCTKIQLYDSNRCPVCKPCAPICPKTLNQCITPNCGPCMEAWVNPIPSTDINGCPKYDCPQCRPRQELQVCPNIRCMPLIPPPAMRPNQAAQLCNGAGLFRTVFSTLNFCCLECTQCQSALYCPTIYCPSQSCTPGWTLTNQFAANGCKICPICKPPTQSIECPVLRCQTPQCGQCEDSYTPTLANNCPGCPICKAVQPMCTMQVCSSAAKCANRPFLDFYNGCCPPNQCDIECQPFLSCRTLKCYKCKPGQNTIPQTDLITGCKMCPKCL